MSRIRALRHDPRLVTPLAVVAVVVSAYAVKQGLPGQNTPHVIVRETGGLQPVSSASFTPSAPKFGSADPFYSERLRTTERSADMQADPHEAKSAIPGELPLIFGQVHPNIKAPNADIGTKDRSRASDPGPSAKPDVSPPKEPDLPAYRFAAYLGGRSPAAILEDEAGGTLYVRDGGLLPDGERLSVLSRHRVALKRNGVSRVLVLYEEAQ